jgi:hypothetical protein
MSWSTPRVNLQDNEAQVMQLSESEVSLEIETQYWVVPTRT